MGMATQKVPTILKEESVLVHTQKVVNQTRPKLTYMHGIASRHDRPTDKMLDAVSHVPRLIVSVALERCKLADI